MNRIPLFFKVMLAGIPILMVLLYVASVIHEGVENRKQFYKRNFSSKVVSSKDYQGRSTEFGLANGLKIYFGHNFSDPVAIGDSVKKDSNTYVYNVYRKNINRAYRFWATYHFEKTL